MSVTKICAASAALAFSVLASAQAQTPQAPLSRGSRPQIAIEPMTQVDPTTGAGYFSDPYPIRIAPQWANASLPLSFSGTTKQILSCWHLLQKDCFQGTPLDVQGGSLAQQAQVEGTTLGAFKTSNIFRDGSGRWHMATTVQVKNPTVYPDLKHWNVIVHAHPDAFSYGVPQHWIADTLLVGSFSHPEKADYDGKYVEASGNLYLLYSRRLSENPAHDGIVAQPMRSETQSAPVAPIVLLAPDVIDGGLNSEYFFPFKADDQFKLVETGNVTVIGGKYVMAYSTGAYDQPNYKTGLAWSDTFLPLPGSTYRKVYKQDLTGVWGQPNHREVLYLLQSQQQDWPNDVASEVLAPGVASIEQDRLLGWVLHFAAYDPGDAPVDRATGNLDGSHRRPYFVRLQVSVPDRATVAGTSDRDLAAWIVPVRQ